MQIATLVLAGIGAVTGTGSLLVMLKLAHELQSAKIDIEGRVDDIRAEANKKIRKVSALLAEVEL